MSNATERVNCLLCGRDDTTVFFRGLETTLVRCRHDGLLYLNPQARAVRLPEAYTHYLRADNTDIFTNARRPVLRREAAAIKQRKPRGRLLDVGCATGVFFENFPDPAWERFGVEPAVHGAALARERYGAQVFNGDLAGAGYPDSFFDVVSMLDTLFVVPDPLAELRRIRRVLKDDGLLAVDIPGLAYRLLRERGPLTLWLDRRWVRGFATSSHLYYFSPRTLRLLLGKAGFRVVQALPEQASLGRASALDALNTLHFRLAQALFAASGGRWSIAAREFYLAVKDGPAPAGAL